MVAAIDVWAQPAPDGAFTSATFATLAARARATDRVAMAASAQRIVAAMDEAGLEKALLSAWCMPDGWMITNEQVAAIVDAFPDRFVGVASADLDDPAAPAQLEHAVRSYGFKALRVLPWIWRRPPNHPSFHPLYEACIRLGVPFCTQVGHTGPRMPSEPGRPIPYLDEVALAFPDLTIVGGHIGHPWTDEMISLAWKYDNVFIDTSAYMPRYYPPQLVSFLDSYGQDKVMFGTNFPMLPFRESLQQAQALGIGEEAKEKFLHANARRVFRLD